MVCCLRHFEVRACLTFTRALMSLWVMAVKLNAGVSPCRKPPR